MYEKQNTVAIITFHTADNYGAVLQNYALQKAIIQLGSVPITIDYQCFEINKVYRIHFYFSSLKAFISSTLNINGSIKRKKRFKAFRNAFIKRTSPCDADTIEKIGEKYDVYITGSDQVWNIDIIDKNNINAYTLGFVKNHTRCSYAASAGEGVIYDKEILSKLKDLDMITVREKSLHDYLNAIGIKSSIVCDPVFLITQDKWSTLLLKNRRNNYLFMYYLDSQSTLCEKIANMISKERKLSICSTAKINKRNILNKYKAYSDGPQEFLSDIYYSNFVVASSFHATAFAIIFEKDFVSVLHKKTGSRVKDLLEYLGLQDRIIADENDFSINLLTPIDYKRVNSKLAEWRSESLKILKEIVG